MKTLITALALAALGLPALAADPSRAQLEKLLQEVDALVSGGNLWANKSQPERIALMRSAQATAKRGEALFPLTDRSGYGACGALFRSVSSYAANLNDLARHGDGRHSMHGSQLLNASQFAFQMGSHYSACRESVRTGDLKTGP